MKYVYDFPLWSVYFDWHLAILTFTMFFLAIVVIGYFVCTPGGTSRSSGLLLSTCLIVAGLMGAGLADQLLEKLNCYVVTDGVCHGFSDVSIWLKIVLAGLTTAGPAFFAAIGGGIFANSVLKNNKKDTHNKKDIHIPSHETHQKQYKGHPL